MHQYLFKITLDKKVYLVQTDTTVGFLSQNHQALSLLKERSVEKPFVTVCSSFKTLKTLSRIPSKDKNRVRRSKKSTFVYPNNKAIRVVKDTKHTQFLNRFGWMYSTSANEKSAPYNKEFAFEKSDIIVEDIDGFYEGEPSAIYKLTKSKRQRLR